MNCHILPAAVLLAWAAAPAMAAPSATARVSATLVEPVPVAAWLGVPVSVQDLVRGLQSPTATGALVPRVPTTGAPPVPPRLPVAQINALLDARTAFAIDLVPGPGVLARGPAASVSAATNGDGATPLVITVAFN